MNNSSNIISHLYRFFIKHLWNLVKVFNFANTIYSKTLQSVFHKIVLTLKFAEKMRIDHLWSSIPKYHSHQKPNFHNCIMNDSCFVILFIIGIHFIISVRVFYSLHHLLDWFNDHLRYLSVERTQEVNKSNTQKYYFSYRKPYIKLLFTWIDFVKRSISDQKSESDIIFI